MDNDSLKQMMEDMIPFNRFLGIRVVELSEKGVHLTLPFRDELVGDPMRPALHGGVISTMADVAGGVAVWQGLDDTRQRVATIDLRIDYLRPARLTTLVAEATVVRVGNRVGVADVRIFNFDEDDVADTVATVKAVYNITIKKDYRLGGDKKSPSFP